MTELVARLNLAGCGKRDDATGILSSLSDFVIREGFWLHLVSRGLIFRPGKHTATSAYVA